MNLNSSKNASASIDDEHKFKVVMLIEWISKRFYFSSLFV
jgi:hypothetical protein